jgi:hypothetical protein
VPRVGDEVTFARDRGLEAGEHLVQGRPEPLQLVPGRRDREALPGRCRRDRSRAAPHRLHRPQRQPGKEVAGRRGDDQRKRACDQQLVAESRERLLAILDRRADREHERPAGTPQPRREDARRLVEAGHRRPVDVDGTAARGLELATGQDRRPTEWSRRVEDTAARGQELGVALAAFHEPARAVVCKRRVRIVDERREILRPQAELAVQRQRQVRGEPQIEEQAGRGEHDRHRDGEGGRDANADRDHADHCAVTRSR